MIDVPRAGWLLVAIAALVAAGPARALSLRIEGPGSGPVVAGTGLEALAPGVTEVSFAIGLDAPVNLNGYDVTLAWDASELALLSAVSVAGLSFAPAPDPLASSGTRVAAITLAAVNSDLFFTATFDVLGLLADGLPDVRVWVDPVDNGSGIAPGSLVLSNPEGAGIDVALVPEPGTATLFGLALVALAAYRRKERT